MIGGSRRRQSRHANRRMKALMPPSEIKNVRAYLGARGEWKRTRKRTLSAWCRRAFTSRPRRPTTRTISLILAVLLISSHLLARRVGEATNLGPGDGSEGEQVARREARHRDEGRHINRGASDQPRQRRETGRHADGLSTVTGNATGWVSTHAWLISCSHDVACVQEHKQRHEEDIAAKSETVYNMGWKSFWSPAVDSQAEAGEPSGGTAVFIKKHLGAREPPGGARVVPGHCAAALIEAGGVGGLVMYSTYLRCGDELGAFNWHVLTTIAAHVRSHGLPWAMGGDWNCTPEALAHSGWVEKIGGVVVKAPVSHTTTVKGKPGRHIDFYVVDKRIVGLGIAARVDGTAPIRTHSAIAVQLPAKPRSFHVTVMKAPRKMPHQRPVGPRKQPRDATAVLEKARRATALAQAGDAEEAKAAREIVMREWTSYVEEELILHDHLDESPEQVDSYRGRADGPTFVREPILGPCRGRAHADAGAENRRLRMLQDRAYELTAAMSRWTAHPTTREVNERARAAIDAAHHVAAAAPGASVSKDIGIKLKTAGRAAERWTKSGLDVEDCHDRADALRAMAWEIGEEARAAADANEADRVKDVRASVVNWCREAEANGAAIAHRWTKLPQEWRADIAEVVSGDVVTVTANPDDVVRAEYEKWCKLWAPSGASTARLGERCGLAENHRR